MTNRETFYRFHTVSSFPDDPFWELETNFGAKEFNGSFLMFFARELATVHDESRWLEIYDQKARAILADLLQLKGAGHINDELAILLQFYISCQIITPFCNNRLYSSCFNWLCNSLADDISTAPKRDYEFGRLTRMVQSDLEETRFFFWKCFPYWLEDLYSYARSTGNLHDLSAAVIGNFLKQIVDNALNVMSENWTLALCQIAAWCNQYHFTEQEGYVIESLYHLYQYGPDPATRKRAAFQLAVGNKTTGGLTKREWIAKVLAEFPEQLLYHEKAQLLILLYQGDVALLIEHLPEIITEIRGYVAEMKYPGNVSSNYHIGSIFKMVEPAIICLLINGRLDLANRLMAAYFQIEEKDLIDPRNLYIIPNMPTGIKYCFHDWVFNRDVDPKEFKEILRVTSIFLSKSISLTDDPDFKDDPPEVYGRPLIANGPILQAKLAEYFELSRLKEIPPIIECNGFSLLVDTQLPLQNLLSFELGRTIPVLRNLTKPKVQRALSRVFIWEGETMTTEMERIGLQEILDAHGIEVVFKVAAASSKEEFLEHFKSATYDALWILSHGEFDHFNAHNSLIDLGNDILVSIDELKRSDYTGEQRRLLVMDMCDGTTTNMNNSVSIGLGASLTHASQSLIGYNWPVENFQGMILGLLFCRYLSAGQTYEEAHFNTIAAFYRGRAYVVDCLSKVIRNDDVLDRIRNVEFDFANFYYWGALNYVQ